MNSLKQYIEERITLYTELKKLSNGNESAYTNMLREFTAILSQIEEIENK